MMVKVNQSSWFLMNKKKSYLKSMFRWIPYAFVRITLALIAGIVLGLYMPGLIGLHTGILIILMLLMLTGIFAFARYFSLKTYVGVAGLILVFVGGYLNVFLSTDTNNSNHLSVLSDPVTYYQVTITAFPQEKKKSWRQVGEVRRVKIGNHWKDTSGKIQLYVNKTDFNTPFRYGDVLLIKGSPQLLSPPKNPHEFDYKKFLSYQNIYHQDFLRDGEVQVVAHDPPYVHLDLAMKARAFALGVIRQYVHGQEEQGIVSALVLGVTDGIDDELLSAYAASGAMHVLAVSGLHVGIIYWIILLLLKPFKRTRAGKWGVTLVSVVVLWGYAFVTGMSPSVLRAATMFTFIAFAEAGHRRTNIYNTLAASAFCLLLFNPFLIVSVGFQLSYLAVLGIVWLFPKINALWAPSSWLLSQIWKITVVSVSAQLATFSLGLLYFHQFPVYFLFSNLFVIPLAFAVLVLGIVLIAVSFSATGALIAGTCLTWVVHLLNEGVLFTESLPFSLVRDVYITTFQCWVLMGLVITTLLITTLRKFYLVYVALVLTLLFTISGWQHDRETSDVQKFTVYSISGHYAMELITQGQSYFFSDSSLVHDEDGLRFHVASNRIAQGVSHIHRGETQPFVQPMNGGRLMVIGDYHVLHVYSRDFVFPLGMSIDYLIVSDNALRDLDEVLTKSGVDAIILDGTNSMYRVNHLREQAKEKSISFHAVLQQGALEIIL